MKWVRVLEVSKDMIGMGESWDINVAWISDDKFAWQTSGNNRNEDDDAPIDLGSADWIADYVIENACGFESELLGGLEKLAEMDFRFLPLLEAVQKRIEE